MSSIIYPIYIFIKSNIFLVSFLSGLITEELVLLLAILAGKGGMSIILVFIGGVLGSLVSDQFYYFLGRSKIIKWFEKKHLVSKNIRALPPFIKKFGERNIFIELFITKIVYGTRTAGLVVMGAKKMHYGKFFVADTLAVLIWAFIMIPIAYLAGMGITSFFKVAIGIEKFLFICLLLILIYFLFVKALLIPFLKKITK